MPSTRDDQRARSGHRPQLTRIALASLAALTALSGCATDQTAVRDDPALRPDWPAAAAAHERDEAALAAERIKRFQYLYGSGEAAAVSIQTYHALLTFARERVARRPADSVVLAEGSTLAEARFVPCGDKPLAAVFDVDETVLLNLGLEAHEAAGEPVAGEMLDRWAASGSPAVAPVPGARFALDALRRMGVAVIFNTNRDNTAAAGTAAQIEAIGLGPALHGETLFLRGDADGAPGKDGRRSAIAARFCVIAMGGDQLGDFSDLFNVRDLAVPTRRDAASRGWAAQLWGKGWFMLPNPVYGPSLRGGIDDVFPAYKRWDDPEGNR
jgi:predicted secreted acid phosphatase